MIAWLNRSAAFFLAWGVVYLALAILNRLLFSQLLIFYEIGWICIGIGVRVFQSPPVAPLSLQQRFVGEFMCIDTQGARGAVGSPALAAVCGGYRDGAAITKDLATAFQFGSSVVFSIGCRVRLGLFACPARPTVVSGCRSSSG